MYVNTLYTFFLLKHYEGLPFKNPMYIWLNVDWIMI